MKTKKAKDCDAQTYYFAVKEQCLVHLRPVPVALRSPMLLSVSRMASSLACCDKSIATFSTPYTIHSEREPLTTRKPESTNAPQIDRPIPNYRLS